MSILDKLKRKPPETAQKSRVPIPKAITEESAASEIFRPEHRQKEISPLNDKVWRLILIIFALHIAVIIANQLMGFSAFFPIWINAVLALAAWIVAVIMLLQDARLKKFWIFWLISGLVFIPIFPGSIGIFGASFGFSFIFLVFRRYKPYKHLTSRRRAALFGLILIMFFMLFFVSLFPDGPETEPLEDGQEASSAPDLPVSLILGQNIARYAIFSLGVLWFFSLFNLFFSIRLHFMRLRPKLAVVAFLLVIVPLFLLTVMGLITLYGTLGASRAIRADLILDDWAILAKQDENFVHMLSKRSFVFDSNQGVIQQNGEAPAWLSEFAESARKTKFAFAEWDSTQIGAYFWVGSELWLMAFLQNNPETLLIRACQLDSMMLDRLARILYCRVRIAFSTSLNLQVSGERVVTLAPAEQSAVDDLVGSFRQEPVPSEGQPETRPPLLKRTIYFGMTDIPVIVFDSGEFSKQNLLVMLEGSLADVASELVSERNPLSQFVVIMLLFLAILLYILEMFAFFFGVRITTGFTSAVRILHRGTRRIAQGDLETRIDIPNEDELGDLAASFNDMMKAIKRGQAEAIERERLESELETARKIQEKLLPHDMPDVPGFEIAGTSLPSQQVGGDYFDFLDRGEGQFGIAIADVSGKGIPAALLMANLQASLHAQAIQPGKVAEVISRINDRLASSTDANMFATFFYGVLDRNDSSFTSTNAGHNPPILLRQTGSVERLEPNGMILGFMQGQKYTQDTVKLDPGDVLVLFTDGITEAADSTLETMAENLFGEERLIDIIKTHNAQSAQEIQSAILEGISAHTANSPQSDDITLVVIKRRM